MGQASANGKPAEDQKRAWSAHSLSHCSSSFTDAMKPAIYKVRRLLPQPSPAGLESTLPILNPASSCGPKLALSLRFRHCRPSPISSVPAGTVCGNPAGGVYASFRPL